jgi:hypothetical protein
MDWVNWALGAGDSGDDWYGAAKFALEHTRMPKRSRNSISTPAKRRRTTSTYRSRKKTSRAMKYSRSYRRRYTRKKPVCKDRCYKQLAHRVSAINRLLKSDQARHTHRRRLVTNIGANAGQVNNYLFANCRTSDIELAMANLRYYNPATPGTLTTANAATGSYERKVHFESIYDKLNVRNNYQVPAMVTVWMCTPKNDTNIAIDSFYSAGVSDQTIGMAVTSPLLYPSDIQQVTANWNMKRCKQIRLEPGRSFDVSYSFGPFDYDPAVVDHHNLVYQKKYKCHFWYIRVEGCIGHDTVAAEYLTTQAAVDCVNDRKYVMTYDAGVNLDDYSEDNDASASFTNAGVVSNKAVSDNQSYSVA